MCGWMVYRCDEHRSTTYVTSDPRHDTSSVEFCCSDARLVDVADVRQFCAALRATIR